MSSYGVSRRLGQPLAYVPSRPSNTRSRNPAADCFGPFAVPNVRSSIADPVSGQVQCDVSAHVPASFVIATQQAGLHWRRPDRGWHSRPGPGRWTAPRAPAPVARSASRREWPLLGRPTTDVCYVACRPSATSRCTPMSPSSRCHDAPCHFRPSGGLHPRARRARTTSERTSARTGRRRAVGMADPLTAVAPAQHRMKPSLPPGAAGRANWRRYGSSSPARRANRLGARTGGVTRSDTPSRRCRGHEP